MGRPKDASLPRKELRKAHRLAAKEKKQQRHAWRAAQQPAVTTSKDPTYIPVAAVSGEKDGSAKDGRFPGGQRSMKGRRDVANKGGERGGGGGNSNESGRRKRWRPEEIDPMIEAEDAEMKRLERLLGVKGPNARKKRAKLERELEVEDGMGDDFGSFLSDLDRIGEAVDGGARSGSSDDGRGHEADWDFHRDVQECSSGSDVDQAEEGADEVQEELQHMEKKQRRRVHWEDTRDEYSENSELEGEDDGEEEEHTAVANNGEDSEKHDMEEPDSEREYMENEEDREEERGGRHALGEHETGGYGDEEEEEDENDENGDNDNKTMGGEGEKESDDFLRHVYRPTAGQDIYGRAIGGNGAATPAKYVPPHLRAAANAAGGAGTTGGVVDQTGNGKRAQVQRVVNGIMNRLSEETLEPVTARLRDTYRGHSTTDVNEALWQATRAVCVHDKHVMTTLIPSFAAVIAALNISLGADVGGFFLETIAKELNADIVGTMETATATATVPGGGVGKRGRGVGSNLLLLLAYLYNYGVAHCTLIYDIIGLLVDAYGENEMELLLILLRHSGFQLRSDDPQALKQIVALVKTKATTAAAAAAAATPTASSISSSTPACTPEPASAVAAEAIRWKTAFRSGSSGDTDDNTGRGSGSGSGSRARYILDTILELQGNKRSRLQEQGQESGRRVRKWLGSVKAAKGGGSGMGGSGDASLRVAWAELVSTESRGRWWRVGAAWAGRAAVKDAKIQATGVRGADVTVEKDRADGAGGASNSNVNGHHDGTGAADDDRGRGDEEEGVGLMELAARQRMNTDVRRSVFVAIVGSSDCEDALEKVLRLNLKGAQEREIARVIVECCCQEGSYNPFYAHLAERACDRQTKLRFTFQVAFWDALKTLDDGAERRAGSLARLMAHLVLRKQLSLTVLKAVEIPELSPSGLLLVRMFFHEIIAAGDDTSFMEVFRRLARPAAVKDSGAGHSAARDNILVFLRGHLGPAPRNWDRERKKAFKKRVKGACRLIDAMVTAEELG